MSYQRSRVLLLVTVALLVLAAPGLRSRLMAQETVEATILKVDVEEPSPKQFSYNDLFQLTVKPGSVPGNIQVRVFRGNKQTLASGRMGGAKQEGRCLVYDSLVLTPQPASSSLNFGWNFDSRAVSWLTRAAGRFEDTVYLLVFEEGGLPQGSVKILADDVKTYFNNGFEIKILAAGFGVPEPPIEPLETASRPSASRPSAKPQPPVTTPDLGCIHVTAVLATGTALAEQVPCTTLGPALWQPVGDATPGT